MKTRSKILTTVIAVLSLLVMSQVSIADMVDQSCWGFGGDHNIGSNEPIGQEFIPSVEQLLGVDLLLHILNEGSPAEPITVQIRVGTIDGPIVEGSSVVLLPEISEVNDFCWHSFVFSEPLSLSPGSTHVIDVSTTTSRWGWPSELSGSCYEPGGSYLRGSFRSADLCFRTWITGPYQPAVDLTITPGNITLPDTAKIEASIGHNSYNHTRRLAGIMSVTLDNGTYFSNWRSGYTHAIASNPTVIDWVQSFPSIPALVGDIAFSILLMDVTPAPYNQPPFPSSGQTATSSFVVTCAHPQ